MKWHNNADERKRGGDEVEKIFQNKVNCSCGGAFKFIGDSYPGCPDYTCENCGQLIDVKSSPQAERTGNIAVSIIPYSNYPDDLLLVTLIKGQWLGEYKMYISQKNLRPFKPTHDS